MTSPTNNTERSVAEVGEVDRYAAADYARDHLGMPPNERVRIREGEWDNHSLVALLASHRTEAEARVGEVDDAAVERLARLAFEVVGYRPPNGEPWTWEHVIAEKWDIVPRLRERVRAALAAAEEQG